MSKMDNLRAMREARYEKAVTRGAKEAAGKAMTPPGPLGSPATASTSREPEAEPCGHRAISGRTCTREAGHAAKSHRYA
jgi:hypothetical protein